jgi:hypothetical protein
MNWPNCLGLTNAYPQAFTEAVVLELFREHRISAGKASELLRLSYREFLDLLQTQNIPVVTTPPRDSQEAAGAELDLIPGQVRRGSQGSARFETTSTQKVFVHSYPYLKVTSSQPSGNGKAEASHIDP